MSNKVLAIIGAGDLGEQIAHLALSDGHYSKVVFFDDFLMEKTNDDCKILGKVDEVVPAFEKRVFDELIIGIGYKHLDKKAALFDFFINQKVPFGKIVHSSAWVDSSAKIAQGVVVYPACIIDANVKIGANSLLNIGSTIAHDSNIAKHCFLSPRVAIAGFTRIGEQCMLGINSTVIDNLNICAHTQIGAGGVVVKSIVKSGLYVGCPVNYLR